MREIWPKKSHSGVVTQQGFMFCVLLVATRWLNVPVTNQGYDSDLCRVTSLEWNFSGPFSLVSRGINLVRGTEPSRNTLNNLGALLTFYFLFFFRFGKPQWRACSAHWCSVGSGGSDWLTPVAFRICRRHVSALESHIKVPLTKQLLSRTRQVQSLFANSFAAGCRI